MSCPCPWQDTDNYCCQLKMWKLATQDTGAIKIKINLRELLYNGGLAGEKGKFRNKTLRQTMIPFMVRSKIKKGEYELTFNRKKS